MKLFLACVLALALMVVPCMAQQPSIGFLIGPAASSVTLNDAWSAKKTVTTFQVPLVFSPWVEYRFRFTNGMESNNTQNGQVGFQGNYFGKEKESANIVLNVRQMVTHQLLLYYPAGQIAPTLSIKYFEAPSTIVGEGKLVGDTKTSQISFGFTPRPVTLAFGAKTILLQRRGFMTEAELLFGTHDYFEGLARFSWVWRKNFTLGAEFSYDKISAQDTRIETTALLFMADFRF